MIPSAALPVASNLKASTSRLSAEMSWVTAMTSVSGAGVPPSAETLMSFWSSPQAVYTTQRPSGLMKSVVSNWPCVS